LGLGVGQYLNKKKIQMLGNPVDYLTNCNNALAAVGVATTNAYDEKLDALVDSIAGPALAAAGLVTQGHVDALNAERLAVCNLPWVKQLAAGLAAKVQAAEVEMVDINLPIQNKKIRLRSFKSPSTRGLWPARRSSLRRAVRASNNYSSSFLAHRI